VYLVLKGKKTEEKLLRFNESNTKSSKARKRNKKTDELIKSGNGHRIHEVSPKGEGDYGGKDLWKR